MRATKNQGSRMAASEPKPCSFLIRPATAQDLTCIRAWLPDALAGTPVARLFLAADVDSGAVAGVAALRVFNDRAGRLFLFVAPGFRRRGGLKANRFVGVPLQLVILEGRITPSTVATLKVGTGERFPTSRQF